MKKRDSVILEEAIQRICENTKRMPVVEIRLSEAGGEVTAEAVRAIHDQPPFPRSPLDGYALQAADSTGAGKDSPVKLKVTGKVCAGEDKAAIVTAGTAVQIMTGAVIPQGADTVIRQEDTDEGAEEVQIYSVLKPYQNYCWQGEDYKKGELLVEKGTVLDYTAITVLASNGIDKVKVYRKPRLAVIATGDELQEPGEVLRPAKIYDSNLYMLRAMLQEKGISCTTLQGPDCVEEMCEVLKKQLKDVDAVITTGGVSVGEKDIMNAVLPKLDARILFEGLQMKPGSPAKFALAEGKPVLALSGNPFAAAATMELLGCTMVDTMQGRTQNRRREKAVLADGFEKVSPGRRFIRGRLEGGRVFLPKGHSSGQIRSMLGCNCLVDIPAGSGELLAGQEVEVWRYSGRI